MLQKEGQVRIPAGCAISGIFHKDGTRENGTRIIDSIRTMHDRSNGLGGGFAGYGIYPEYADYYAFHVFYDTQAAKEECEREIERHFDIVNLSKIPTRRHPRITDAPMIWRYFVTPLPTKLAASQLEECEFTSRFVIRINHTHRTALTSSPPARTWAFSRQTASPRTSASTTVLEELRGLLLDLPWPLSDQHTGLVGRRASVCTARLPRSFTTARFPLMMQTAASLRCSATTATC